MAFDPDAFLAQPTQAAPTPQAGGFDPDAFLSEGQEQPTDIGGTIQAGAEGALRGVISSPGAALVEKGLGLATREGIRARQEAHPIAAGIGEGAGLVGGALTGVGEGAALEAIGKGTTEAAGLADATRYIPKVGSSVVKNAAEMAAYQMQDEVGKAVLGDPTAGAEAAITNIGLAAAIGGAGGGFITGAVSPLWKATAGPKATALLDMAKAHWSGEGIAQVPEQIGNDLKTLGVEVSPIQAADLSDNPTASRYVRDLSRAENESMLSEQADLQKKVSDKVFEPLGMTTEEMRVYDKNQEGQILKDQATKAFEDKFDPIVDELDKIKEQNGKIKTTDDDLLRGSDSIKERGVNNQQIQSKGKYQQIYNEAADDFLGHKNLADLDRQISEVGAKTRIPNPDMNITNANRDLYTHLKALREQLIMNSVSEGGPEAAAAQRAIRSRYANAESLREQLEDHFNMKDSKNFRQFLGRLQNDVTPEQLMNKFSIKNNMDGAKFLSENFPDLLQTVVKNERKNLLKPAVLSAAKKGENPIDVNKLSDILNNAKSGHAQYVNAVLPQEFLNKAEAGARILRATSKAKDSGTPAGMWSLFKHVGPSALGAVGWLTGHGPMQSILLGELAAKFGKELPEHYKLAMLKLLGSSKPTSAEGFKAAASYMKAATKGMTTIEKASKNVFKPGTKVLIIDQGKNSAQIEKLDKLVASNDPKDMHKEMNAQNGGLGHYMPDHQTAMTQTSLNSLNYLKSIRPEPTTTSPLARETKPSAMAEAKYNRALRIAVQPAVVLQHVKDGTLTGSDVQHLQVMYPALAQHMKQQLTNEMIAAKNQGTIIPATTKRGMSLFLGQPMVNSLTPQGIMSAQPPPPQPPPQQNAPMKGRKGKTAIDKGPNMYKTASQSAEQDRSDRD